MIGGIPVPTLVAEISGTHTNAVSNSFFEETSVPRTYLLHNKGVCCSNTPTTAAPALTISGLPEGSVMILVNSGGIYARGGDGGQGGDATCTGTASPNEGRDGVKGGPACVLQNDCIIENINGAIFGGGGGGGGGSGWNFGALSVSTGGGGGGGQSYVRAVGGAPGTRYGACSLNAGDSGTSGTFAAAGTGGAGGGALGYVGGDGGAWATAGDDGSSGAASGGTGGLAGEAIITNGYDETIVSGAGAANLKGSIS